MNSLGRVKRSNYPLIVLIFALVVFGLVILYSVSGPAGYQKGSSWFYVKKQIIFSVMGLAACYIISFLPKKFFKSPIIWGGAFGATLLLVVAVKAVGIEHNNAKRWIGIKNVFEFQPSDFYKIGCVLFFAGYREFIVDFLKKKDKEIYDKEVKALSDNDEALMDAKKKYQLRRFWRHFALEFITPIMLCASGALFILDQPHISCFLIIALVVFICALNARIDIRYWIMGIIVLAVAGILVGTVYIATNPNWQDNFAHAGKRFDIIRYVRGDETVDVSEDDVRQVVNAHNALGSGGLLGTGLGKSRAKYHYVSEAQNDYIFSIYIEETGFVGGVLLISFYLAFFYMCLRVIMRADSLFAKILASGSTAIIIVQAFLNLAVELVLIPPTGVTLPFISYGGTAQVSLLIACGLILFVSRSCTTSPNLEGKL